MTPRLFACLLSASLLAACGGTGSGGGAEIRQVGGRTIVTDALGPQLVIDENGCQTVVPAGGGAPELVRDGAGQPVCVPLG